jgi:hypothetical protein
VARILVVVYGPFQYLQTSRVLSAQRRLQASPRIIDIFLAPTVFGSRCTRFEKLFILRPKRIDPIALDIDRANDLPLDGHRDTAIRASGVKGGEISEAPADI